MANFKINGHPVYSEGLNAIAFPPSENGEVDFLTDYTLYCMVPYREGKSSNSVEVRIRGNFESGKELDYTVRWNFERDLSKVDPKLIVMLQLFSSVHAALLCKRHGLPDIILEGEWPGAFPNNYWAELDRLWKDLTWQNKLAHFYSSACWDEHAPDWITGLLSGFLPETPWESYFGEKEFTHTFLKNHLVSWDRITPEDVCLSMSFGKESLLSLALMRELYPRYQFNKLELSAIKHSAKYQHVDSSAIDKLNRVLGTKFHLTEVSSNLREKALENFYEKDVWSGFGIAAMHIAQFIATDRPVVIYGDEYERSFESKVFVDDTPAPNYTLDYVQNAIWHAKVNSFMEVVGLPNRMSSILFNLSEFQVQWLLAKLAPELLDIQTSCWYGTDDEPWCNDCSKCSRVSFMRQAMFLPLPEGLKPYRGQLSNGRQAFAVDLGAGNVWSGDSPVGAFLDKSFEIALHNIHDNARIGLDRMLKLQPFDQFHPNILRQDWIPVIEQSLANHPLS